MSAVSIPTMPLDLAFNVQSDLEWYNTSSLKIMLRWRSSHRAEAASKAEVLALLHECLLDSSSIHSALLSADPVAQQALALLKHKGGAMPLAAMIGQLAVWHPELTASQLRAVPSELVRRALAFWHTTTAHVSRGLLHDILRPAADNLSSVVIYSAPQILEHVSMPPGLGESVLTPVAPAELSSSPAQWQRRILLFLRAVEDRAPRILQSGTIGSRDREALAQIVGLDDTVPGAPRLSPVSFYRTTLGQAGLLEVGSDRQLRITPSALRFVSLSPFRQVQVLLDAWIESEVNELQALGHLRCERRATAPSTRPGADRIRQAHRFLVDLLRAKVRPGNWYSLADISHAVRHSDVEFLFSWLDPAPYRWGGYETYSERRPMSFPSYSGLTLEDSRGRSRSLVMGEDWDLVEGAFIRAVFQGPLSWLGIVECGMTDQGSPWFTLTPLGAQALELAGSIVAPDVAEITANAGALIVQPNFEVVIYAPEERPELLYHVDRFAEKVSVDRLAIYRLTAPSVATGLQLGLGIEDVINLLEGAAREPVPQNVTFTLRDWARRFEEVHWVRNAWLIEASSATVLDRWLEEPALAAVVERRLSPTVALCRGERPPDLLDRLAALGADVNAVDANAPLRPCGRVEGPTAIWLPADEANWFLRGALAEFADLRSEDEQGCRYVVTPQSVGRAVTQGKAASDILRVLDQIVRGTAAEGLRVRIKGWAGAYKAARLGVVGFLVVPDPEALRELRTDPALASCFVQTISPTEAIVRSDRLEILRRALAERGIPSEAHDP